MEKEYDSLEDYEFQVLEEIPKDSLKPITITKEQLKLVCDLVKIREAELKEYLGQHRGINIYYKICRNGYRDYMPTCYLLTDKVLHEAQKERTLKVNRKEIDFKGSELFDTEIAREFVRKEQEVEEEAQSEFKIYSWETDYGYDNIVEAIMNSTMENLKENCDNEILKLKKIIKNKYEEKQARLEEERKEKMANSLEIQEKYERGEKINYDKNYALNGAIIEGKEIKHGEYTYKFNVNVCKLLKWADLSDVPTRYGDLQSLAYYLNDKKIDYELMKINMKKYKVEFGDKVKVDDVEISASKLVFFLKRADGTSEKIKKLKKLTGRDTQLMDLKEVKLSYYNCDCGWSYLEIPFQANTDDGKNYDIKFMGEDFKVSGEVLVNFFFGTNIQLRQPSPKELTSFAVCLGKTKAEFFDYISRIKLVNSLGD